MQKKTLHIEIDEAYALITTIEKSLMIGAESEIQLGKSTSFKQLMTDVRSAVEARIDANAPSSFDNKDLKMTIAETMGRILNRDTPIGEYENLELIITNKKETWQRFREEIGLNMKPIINLHIGTMSGCLGAFVVLGFCFVLAFMTQFIHPFLGLAVFCLGIYGGRHVFALAGANGNEDELNNIPYFNLKAIHQSVIARNLSTLQTSWREEDLEKAIKILLFEQSYSYKDYGIAHFDEHELITNDSTISIFEPAPSFAM